MAVKAPAATDEKLYRVALREALNEEMERDDSVYVIGEDIGKFGGAYRVTEGLLDRFGPQRVVDAPIAEEVIVGCDRCLDRHQSGSPRSSGRFSHSPAYVYL